jgi:hypothetical protein
LWASGEGRVVACSGRQIVASDDDGVTWLPTSCRGKYNDNLRHAGGTLLATNIRSRVLRSTDTGQKWKSLESTSKKYLYSIDANAAGTICAGTEGAAAISHDAGATFKLVRFGHREYMRATHVFASGDALLLGDHAKAHLVTAKGKVKQCDMPPDVCVFAVCARDDELWAVGHVAYGAAIVRSRDRGATWQTMKAPEGRCLHAVTALPDGRVIAVGESGLVRAS